MKHFLKSLLLVIVIATVHSSEYMYKNVNEWYKEHPTCRGHHQSPINIPKNVITIKAGTIKPKFVNYDKRPLEMFLSHTGHSVNLVGTWKKGEEPMFYGDGIYIQGKYVFQQMHWHWAQTNDIGSEHVFHGHSMQLEGHLVHKNIKYAKMEEAAKHKDGIVVVAHTYMLSNHDNLGPMSKALKQIVSPGDNQKLIPFDLNELNVQMTSSYYSYRGSLTTPPCSEAVTWFINAQPLGVSNSTLNAFRKIKLSGDDFNNVRPIQPRNGREILKFVLED